MSNESIQAIEARDAERVRATVAGDLAALADVLSDTLVYTHGSASVDTKAQYLENIRSGLYAYKAIANLSRGFRVVGDVAMVNGDARIDVHVKGTPKVIMSRYLAVWMKEDGVWRMVSWQSTPIPA